MACHVFYIAFKMELFRDFAVIDRTDLKEILKKRRDIMMKFLLGGIFCLEYPS